METYNQRDIPKYNYETMKLCEQKIINIFIYIHVITYM